MMGLVRLIITASAQLPLWQLSLLKNVNLQNTLRDSYGGKLRLVEEIHASDLSILLENFAEISRTKARW